MPGFSHSIFLDTNILVYAADSRSLFHQKAKEILERAAKAEFTAVISPQIIFEFYSLVTNKKRIKNYFKQEEAVDFIERVVYFANIKMIFPGDESVKMIFDLLRVKLVADREIFDVEIIATMLVNGVKTIYTANKKDFVKLSSEIEAINPFSERSSETKTLKATLTEAQQ